MSIALRTPAAWRASAPALASVWALSVALATSLPAFASTTAPATAPAPLRVQDVAVLASTCANCHGPDGRSTGGMPQLRGLPAEHLLKRMQAFKAGTAPDATVMTRLMKGYDEAQIEALAQWFSQPEGK